ncbi:hypothetical protein F5146DRAFT_1030685 [Armillaria mellea]|nr:hypothetical protein F5146DRAFT_1030685 [Armillaria mellea]
MTTSFTSFTSTTITAPLPSYNKRLISYSTISEGEPPHKKQRNMSSLRRTHSYLSLTDLPNQPQQSMYMAPTRGRCRGRKVSMAPPAGWRLPSLSGGVDGPEPRAYYGPLQSSAEASASSAACSSRVHVLRHCPPRKGEPDLHRIAITTCMRSLTMGPRIAMSIANATRELERMVTEGGMDSRTDDDIVMGDSTAEPWINVSRGDDWEMIHCGA